MKAITDVCPIGFGCWGIGGHRQDSPPAYGVTDDGESVRALECALERGVNFFDTSGLYGGGHSERLLGEVTRGHDVILASKAGYADAVGGQCFALDYLEGALAASESRLGRVDLFQVHDPPAPVLKDDAFWEALLAWRQAGRFRYLGVSLRRPADAFEIVGRVPLDAAQLNFSLVDQRARLEGVLTACSQLTVIARTPLGFGYLAGAQALSPVDHRLRFSAGQRELWESARGRFSALLEGPSPAAKALRYCLSYPEVSVVIPGMLTREHVVENLGALTAPPLSLEARSAVEALYGELTLYAG